MKFTTLSRRTAAAGAASALVAGALVGATTTAAQAAEVTNEYLCVGGSSPFPMTLVSDIPLISNFPSIGAGFEADAGLLDVVNTVSVPEGVVTIMQGAAVTKLESPDFAGSIGTTKVGVDGVDATLASGVDNGDTWSFSANGLNAAFEVPRAGTYDVKSPEVFTILAKNANDATVVSVTCNLTTPGTNGTYDDLLVTKNASTTTAKAPAKAVAKGNAAKVPVTVSGPDFQTPGGKVILKKGTRTLDKANLNNKGKAVLSTKALKVGKNKLTVVYKGDGYTNKSKSKAITVKVKR